MPVPAGGKSQMPKLSSVSQGAQAVKQPSTAAREKRTANMGDEQKSLPEKRLVVRVSPSKTPLSREIVHSWNLKDRKKAKGK